MRVRRYQRLLNFRNLHAFGEDFIGLFYPRCCMECGRHLFRESKPLCHVCLAELPLCGFSARAGNRVEELFYGRVRLEAATSYLYFKKYGIVQRLSHQLKYKGRQDIGRWAGEVLGEEMLRSERFLSIDLVMPVPLHSKKLRKRGYNQVTRFGQGLADQLNVPFKEDILTRCYAGRSLTAKNRIERNETMKDAFSLACPGRIRDKHILLVDDIITSGATLEACARMVLNVPGTRVSLATMAVTL